MALNALQKYIKAEYGGLRRPHITRFAAAVGVSEGAVVKWILRDRRPRYDTIKRIDKLTQGRVGIDDW